MNAILSLTSDLPFVPNEGDLNPNGMRLAPVEQIAEHSHDMRGELTTREAIVKFIEAGNATCTIRSKSTGKRLTFKFSRPKQEENKPRPIWVSVLTGANNNDDYCFMGTVWQGATGYTYRPARQSRIEANAPSTLALSWLLKSLNAGADVNMLRQAEFWHEGRCGRCGRKLTVPESIESGFGPECITKV